MEGRLPPRVLGLVVEWAANHREELLSDREKARNEQPLTPIKPLDWETGMIYAIKQGTFEP
ncbi:MAG: hypothetical protein GF401_18725 [Chitinivibrionales bacterium]|nr:hypothetical protein [Chitinivibrionales bacterium]